MSGASSPSATIFALASGLPPCAIAVIRVSGPLAGRAPAVFGASLPSPRGAVLRRLRDPGDRSLIDEVLLLYFPGPGSSTGEDVLEIHCHGSRAVIRRLLDALGGIEGFEPAGPGDFTRQAFLAGKIDLTRVEALGDLLHAQTDRQRRAALSLWDGGLTNDVDRWRDRLIMLAARLEMALDFADEGDAEQASSLRLGVVAELTSLANELEDILARPRSARLRDGIRVVLAGPVNAGKSTLFNCLVGREAALVSDEAGTTRDVIEAAIDIGGLPFLLCDTAGLRDAEGAVERAGIGKAQALIELGDIVLWLGDGPPPGSLRAGTVLHVHAKADLGATAPSGGPPGIAVSALTGEGLDDLRAALLGAGERLVPGADEAGLSDRHAAILATVLDDVQAASGQTDGLLMAEHVRQARAGLDRLVGRQSAEEMFDALFGRFCVGK